MRALLLICCLLFVRALSAQQIVAEVGRNTCSFDYADSEGNALKDLYPQAHLSFALGYRGSLGERFHYTGQLLFNHYGSEAAVPELATRLVWDMEYLGLGLAMDGELFRKKGIILLLRAAAEPQFMLKGTQTINEQLYDLKGVEQFDKPFLFLRGGAGMNYCADERTVITLRYMYGRGLPMGSSSDGESLDLVTSTVSLGLLWNLGRCRYCRGMRLQ